MLIVDARLTASINMHSLFTIFLHFVGAIVAELLYSHSTSTHKHTFSQHFFPFALIFCTVCFVQPFPFDLLWIFFCYCLIIDFRFNLCRNRHHDLCFVEFSFSWVSSSSLASPFVRWTFSVPFVQLNFNLCKVDLSQMPVQNELDFIELNK